jgi:hypothetical protein
VSKFIRKIEGKQGEMVNSVVSRTMYRAVFCHQILFGYGIFRALIIRSKKNEKKYFYFKMSSPMAFESYFIGKIKKKEA